MAGSPSYLAAMIDVLQHLPKSLRPAPVVSVLRLYGTIGPGGALSRSLSDEALAPIVARAFKPRRLKAVALSVNSPGGSPAQSAMIAARIRRLADEDEIPVFAFCEDLAASGGYWLACAADEIYADRNAIVGSIGVVSAGFGLQEAIARLGIERRVHTAGSRKALLDPFRPEDPQDVERLKDLQRGIHENFIAHVKQARGSRLNGSDETLFSGDVWLASAAQEHGLIDGIGHLVPVMKDRFGEDIAFRIIEARRPLLQRLGAPGAAAASEGATQGAMQALTSRAQWARYGL